jgi:hypothetical protein
MSMAWTAGRRIRFVAECAPGGVREMAVSVASMSSFARLVISDRISD